MKRRPFFLVMLLTAVLLAGWAGETLAATPAVIEQRIENQHQRIKDGVRKGDLTKKELDAVRNNLDWIEDTFKRMKRDGLLTPPELDKLENMLDRNSKMINREVRDFDNVYWGSFADRIRDQRQRIKEGIATNRLTRPEADILIDNIEWIQMTFDNMKRDGRLGLGEQKRLDEMLDNNSEMIFKKKHNQDFFNFRVRFKDFR